MEDTLDLEARAHSEHPEALRLWLRLLTCAQLIEKQVALLAFDTLPGAKEFLGFVDLGIEAGQPPHTNEPGALP